MVHLLNVTYNMFNDFLDYIPSFVYRPQFYPGTDAFVLCFSLVDPTSFENIESKWVSELKHHCPTVPIVLVGMKKDLRHCNNMKENGEKNIHTQREEGLALAERIKAFSYIECSAKTGDNVREVFESATKAALQEKPKSRVSKKCNIL